jgi:hypothetical protein
MYVVEQGIAPPPPRQHTRYPFRDMSVGDSFIVDDATRANVANAAVAYGRRHNCKFTVRQAGNGAYRCWRVQ